MASAPEPKVIAATAGSAGSDLVLWLLDTYAFHGAVPGPVAVAVGVIVPGIVTFAAGWFAKHVDRQPAVEAPVISGGTTT